MFYIELFIHVPLQVMVQGKGVVMPRPFIKRFIRFWPRTTLFKPAGIPARIIETMQLEADEMEAIRLKDLEGLDQEEIAKKMKISRPTVVRILKSGRKKVADALFNGKAIEFITGKNAIFGRNIRRRFGR